MSKVSEFFPKLDRLVHEPARLAILTVLSACECADFLFLERATGLTRGNLSVQLSRLEEADLVKIEKTIVHKRTLTTVSLNGKGHVAIDDYCEAMGQLLRARKKEKIKAARGLTGRPAPAVG